MPSRSLPDGAGYRSVPHQPLHLATCWTAGELTKQKKHVDCGIIGVAFVINGEELAPAVVQDGAKARPLAVELPSEDQRDQPSTIADRLGADDKCQSSP